jgi:hypothetical protein
MNNESDYKWEVDNSCRKFILYKPEDTQEVGRLLLGGEFSWKRFEWSLEMADGSHRIWTNRKQS